MFTVTVVYPLVQTYLFIVNWETSFATYINMFPLCGCLLAALAYVFRNLQGCLLRARDMDLSKHGQSFIVPL